MHHPLPSVPLLPLEELRRVKATGQRRASGSALSWNRGGDFCSSLQKGTETGERNLPKKKLGRGILQPLCSLLKEQRRRFLFIGEGRKRTVINSAVWSSSQKETTRSLCCQGEKAAPGREKLSLHCPLSPALLLPLLIGEKGPGACFCAGWRTARLASKIREGSEWRETVKKKLQEKQQKLCANPRLYSGSSSSSRGTEEEAGDQGKRLGQSNFFFFLFGDREGQEGRRRRLCGSSSSFSRGTEEEAFARASPSSLCSSSSSRGIEEGEGGGPGQVEGRERCYCSARWNRGECAALPTLLQRHGSDGPWD